MDYRQLLVYYLSSDEWELEMLFFFEGWSHTYDLYEGTPNYGKVYPCSEIYLQHNRKLSDGGGTYLDLYLTDQQFQKYFNRRYSATQRFSVLFGMWWGLSEPQIRRIADLRQKNNCSHWLNYFLCNPDASPDISIEELHQFRYSGKYMAEIYDSPPGPFRSPQKLIPLEEVEPLI